MKDFPIKNICINRNNERHLTLKFEHQRRLSFYRQCCIAILFPSQYRYHGYSVISVSWIQCNICIMDTV